MLNVEQIHTRSLCAVQLAVMGLLGIVMGHCDGDFLKPRNGHGVHLGDLINFGVLVFYVGRSLLTF